MASPSEMIEKIHDGLATLPDQVAQVLGNFQQPELPQFDFGGQDFGAPAMPEMSDAGGMSPTGAPGQATSLPEEYATLTEFPSFGSPEIPDSSFPNFTASGLEASQDAFPEMAGFSSEASSFPSPAGAEYDTDQIMLGHMAEIAAGIKEMNRSAPAQRGFQRSEGPIQRTGQSFYVRDPEADEGFAAASPSIDRGSLAGLRGAGGYGYGSRFSKNPKAAQSDFLEHGRQ